MKLVIIRRKWSGNPKNHRLRGENCKSPEIYVRIAQTVEKPYLGDVFSLSSKDLHKQSFIAIYTLYSNKILNLDISIRTYNSVSFI